MTEPSSITRRDFVRTLGAAGAVVLAADTAPAAEAKEIGLSLLGVAHMHTPMYLQILKTREDVRVKFVWDRDPERAAKVAALCGARVAKTVAEALDPGVSGVVVLSETSLHAELATAAAKAGKHLFVEKPLGVGARDALEIARAIEAAGVLFTTGYHLRSIPKYIFVKEQIAKGSLGRIVRAHCAFSNDCVLQGAFDKELGWTVDPKWGALGGFADTGTHAVDMLMWLLGDVASVAGQVRSVVGRYPGCDECGQGLLRFRNDVMGSVAAAWVEPENPVQLQISGTEGHAVVFNDRLYLRTKKVPGADGARPWGKLPPGPDHPMVQFIDAVSGKKGVPLVTPGEAAGRVEVIEALYASARQGRWVDVA